MALVTQEGPIKVEKKVEDEEEILPDGTIHHVHRERSSSVKNVTKCIKTEDGEIRVVEETKEEVPGSLKEELVETLVGPAKAVHEEKEYDEILEDGTKVHKHVVLNRLQHHIHTHQESFDSDHGRKEEDFDIDEVVPGTESVFVVADGDESENSSLDGEDRGSNAASASADWDAAGSTPLQK